MKFLPILFISILLITYCGGVKKFSTSGIYSAPKSNLRIEITSRGNIRDSDDLAFFAQTDFKITSTTSINTEIVGKIEFTEDKEFITIDNYEHLNLDFRKLLLEKLTKENTSLETNEFDEILRAIRGCQTGPKGILLKGQTEYLIVVDTKYKYE